MRRLSHTNIVQFLGSAKTPEPVLVMMLYHPDLSLLKEARTLDEGEAAVILRQLLEGTAYMHKHGIIHRCTYSSWQNRKKKTLTLLGASLLEHKKSAASICS